MIDFGSFPVTENADGSFEVPDVKEFVSGCKWEEGKFVVPAEISGTVRYTSAALALAEAELLLKTIRTAQEIASQ